MANEEKALEIVEVAKNTGKIKKGANEVTKALEKGIAKFVVVASDVTPPEVVMHIPLLAKEKDVPCVTAGTKETLGTAAGLEVGTSAVVIIEPGEAKDLVKAFVTDPKKEEVKEEQKEETKEETKEDAKEEQKEETKAEEKKEENAA